MDTADEMGTNIGGKAGHCSRLYNTMHWMIISIRNQTFLKNTYSTFFFLIILCPEISEIDNAPSGPRLLSLVVLWSRLRPILFKGGLC